MTNTLLPSEISFAWQCEDCRQTGTITARFPIHPDDLAGKVWGQHREAEQRRHCMCPGHYLSFAPLVRGDDQLAGTALRLDAATKTAGSDAEQPHPAPSAA